MKPILIKIGKVFTTVRRDGILVGGRRVLNYLAIFLKTIIKVGSGDVLIITGGVGDASHLRAYNIAEELNLHGIKSSVMLQDNPMLWLYGKKFTIFIFQRTICTPTVEKLIKNVKEQKKEIIFETDDLVFDARYIHDTDLYKNKMTVFEKMQYKHGVGEEILKDPYTKVCTTTTSYLADKLREYGKKVFIVKSKVSLHEQEVAEKIIRTIPKTDDGLIRIGYYSGTHSHNRDFATITSALYEIMDKYGNARLILAGPLDVESELNKFRDRIITLPLVSRDKYYENMWKADINLAPLVSSDPFCEAKSELKFFEPGILGVPTVAIRNRTFSEAIEDGVDGFLADEKEEWMEKVGKLITDNDLRRRMGERAREKVLREYTVSNSHSDEYYAYLKEKIKADDHAPKK